jgi:hypothetical protein
MRSAGARVAVLTLIISSPLKAEDATRQSTIAEISPSVIKSVKIESPKYSYQKSFELEWPVVSFSVVNKSKITIQRLYLKGTLKAPGRAVPWIDGVLDVAAPGGIEPGETKHFQVEPGVATDWRAVPEAVARKAVFSLTLSAIEDAGGKQIRE